MAIVDTLDLGNGTSCKISPSWGCNLFSWKVEGTELMFCPEDHPDAAEKITGGGNPVLFPAIGRTWDRTSGEPVPGLYRIHGIDKTFYMPSHGILFLSKFEKVEETKSSLAYRLNIPEKVREENYPFDVTFEQRFTLNPTSVDLEMFIRNDGDTPAPAACGYHGYYRISNPAREAVEVRLPVKKHLLVTKDTVLLTGESQDTDGAIDLRPDIYYDNVFGDITGRRMSLIDRKAGHAVHVDFDEKCELLVLYSPPDADFVCIEPWTRGLGAYEHLRNPGWEDGKLIPVLQPGEEMTFGATFSVSQL